MKLILFAGVIILAGCSYGQGKAALKEKPTASDIYMKEQAKIIEAHAAILAEQGRMPVDFWRKEEFLGRYAWHVGGVSEPTFGSTPPVALLRRGNTGTVLCSLCRDSDQAVARLRVCWMREGRKRRA